MTTTSMRKALEEFVRIDGFISMHEMFMKDWEPAIIAAKAALAEDGWREWPLGSRSVANVEALMDEFGTPNVRIRPDGVVEVRDWDGPS